jgi:hypothetical protein
MSSSSDSSHLPLNHCVAPDPLRSGNEYGLCSYGFALNHQHTESQLTEDSLSEAVAEAQSEPERSQLYELLRIACVERHRAMRGQFEHIKDCFICSVAFALTPAVNSITAHSSPLAQRLARLVRPGSFSH